MTTTQTQTQGKDRCKYHTIRTNSSHVREHPNNGEKQPDRKPKRLLVPHSIHHAETPDNFQESLADTPENEVQWESVLDQKSIDTNLL